MKRTLMLFVVGAALLGIGVQSASAVWVGSGWKGPGFIGAFTIADDTVTYAVDWGTYNDVSVSAHNTAFTYHLAVTDCKDAQWPFFGNYPEWGPPIYSATIGGPSNESVTPMCDSGYELEQGGAFIEEAF